jgi:PAP2 superfamily
MADVLRLVYRPVRGALRGPRRLFAALDSSDASRSAGGAAMRRLLGGLFLAYATLLGTKAVLAGSLPSVAHILLAMFGVALFANLAGRFIRDWTLVLAGVFAYLLAGRYAQGLNMPIYYTPQLDVDRLIGLGNVPSAWLQSHLYHGRTGPLEVFAVAMYVSHFFAPLLLGFYIWLRRMTAAFKELMFGILATSVLADIVFVLFPTAPPWLAAQRGLVHVHHLLKQSLADLHVTGMASLIGDSHAYNIVAALPSMHAAFPMIGLIVALRYALPRWIVLLQAGQFLGVCFSIVYLGDHYVVDAIAGVLFAWAGATIAHRLLARAPRPSLELRVPQAAEPQPVVLQSRP